MRVPHRMLLLSTVVSGLISGCGGGGDTGTGNVTPPPVTPVSSAATGTVSSDTQGVQKIATESGAAITVPEGAVPKTSAGGTGTIAFSIEKDAAAAIQLPAGVTRGGDVYRFGPGGTIFTKPVSVTLPVSGNPTQDQLVMYRVNPTTGVSEPYAAVYDATTQTLTAQTYQFSGWFWGTRAPDDTASGCVKVDNGSSNIWRTVVTETYSMKYPNSDSTFRGASATWAAIGTIGWTSASDWYLPQGSYQMCVEGDVNGVSKHSVRIPVEISKPWRYDAPVCTPLGISSVVLSELGRCSQSPVPTPSVGTGALQISLSWYSAVAVDLDLSVVEPAGETIDYDNRMSAAGGQLDRDNQCGNYINGQSENIYWTTPRAGQYTLRVHLFSNCSLGTTSMPYSVRVVNKGVTTTYTGTAILSGTAPQVLTTITVN